MTRGLWEAFWKLVWTSICTAVFWGLVALAPIGLFYLGWYSGADQVFQCGVPGLTFFRTFWTGICALSAVFLGTIPFFAPVIMLDSRVDYGTKTWYFDIIQWKRG